MHNWKQHFNHNGYHYVLGHYIIMAEGQSASSETSKMRHRDVAPKSYSAPDARSSGTPAPAVGTRLLVNTAHDLMPTVNAKTDTD